MATAQFAAGLGIVGDAHAGSGHRQVSLLAQESMAGTRAVLPCLAHGAFGENIVTSGVDLAALAVGDRLVLGDSILLEITQVGKECHRACAIRDRVGDCIMPREGRFCRVLQGGQLRPGDDVAQQARLAGATLNGYALKARPAWK